MDFIGTSLPVSRPGFESCLDVLSVGAAELWTLLTVETKGCGFLKDRRPLILFERHVFHQNTAGVFDIAHPAISSPIPGEYLGWTQEYERLGEAIALNRDAALRSASWGIGQVMGFNAKLAGFATAKAMVSAMQDSEDAQLMAVANFLRAKKLHSVLANHDWAAFARQYNGPDFQKNQYDTRLAAAFAGFSTGLMPDVQVRQAQMLPMFLGLDAGAIDGIAGKRTRSAAAQFRSANALGNSDVIDDALIATLTRRLQTTAANKSRQK